MVGAKARQLQIGDARAAAAWGELGRLAQHGGGRPGDRRPGERGRRSAAPRPARRRATPGCSSSRRPRRRGRPVVERHEAAGAGGEHVLRVPVRRRDDAAAGRDRERERAGSDLLPVAVRRHEHVGRREQVGELVDREEPVVELDVLAEPELEHASLEHQAVLLALAVRDVGMRAPGDHVSALGWTLEHRRQRLDHGLEPLARRDQPERREQERVAARRRRRPSAAAPARTVARARRAGRRAVRHDPDLLLGAGAALDEQAQRRLGHHDHQLGLARIAAVSTSS